MSIGIGLRAQKGGAVFVAVSAASEILLSGLVDTAGEGDRLALEPYGVARELGATAEAAAAVAEGRARQERAAVSSLRAVIGRLRQKPAVAALLVNRAGWISDLIQYSQAWPEHVPVAENLAVRDALRSAIRQCGIELVEIDEKSLGADPRLKTLASSGNKPWRRQEKLACLAALTALSSSPSSAPCR